MILFLNGTSSSGKSVIAREIMHQSERPFFYYSIDHLVNFWIDEKFIAFEDEPKSWFFQQHILDANENKPHSIEGPNANQLHWDMIEALLVLIKKGYDIIIDEVLWNREIFQRYAHALAHSKQVYLVKIICELMVAERREKVREDRYVGLARALYEQVYIAPPNYDLEIDTTYTPVDVCAKNILQFVQKNTKPVAFTQFLRGEVSFKPLAPEHFFILQEWMNTPHVNNRWGENRYWTVEEIEAKYQSYVDGYKIIEGKQKQIKGFIIYCSLQAIGYIQYYNVFDFPREGYSLENMPVSMAALDIFIGAPQYLNKGIGTATLKLFLTQYVWPYFENCFVDVDIDNLQAIHAYQNAGFKIVKQLNKPPVLLMINKRK